MYIWQVSLEHQQHSSKNSNPAAERLPHSWQNTALNLHIPQPCSMFHLQVERVWMTYQCTYLQKTPKLPYHTILIDKTPNIFHSCYSDTKDSHTAMRSSISPGILSVHCRQQTQPQPPFLWTSTHYTNGVTSLIRIRASHILWERAPKEKKLSLKSAFGDFSHRHGNSTQGQLFQPCKDTTIILQSSFRYILIVKAVIVHSDLDHITNVWYSSSPQK